jgi:autotransporter-associated beta strand protein
MRIIRNFLAILVAVAALLAAGPAAGQASSIAMLANWFRYTQTASGARLMASPEEVQRAVSALTNGDATHRARLDASITKAQSDIGRMRTNYQSTAPSFSFEARSILTEAAVLYRIARGVQAATGSPSITTLNLLRDNLVLVEMDLVGALQRVGVTTVGIHVGQGSNIQPLAVIYDGLYDDFTVAQRQSIAAAIVNYGIIPAFTAMLAPETQGDRKWWAKSTSINNWSTIIVGGAGVMGSLALRQADYDGSFSCWPGTSTATSKVTKTFREHFDAYLPAAVGLFTVAMKSIPDMGGMWDEGPGYSHDFGYPLFASVASLEVARQNTTAAPPTFLSGFATQVRTAATSFIEMGIHFSGPQRQEFTYNDGNWSFTDNALCFRLADYARQGDAVSLWRAAAWRCLDRAPTTWSGLHLLWYGLFDWNQPSSGSIGMSGFDPATIPLSHYFHGARIESSPASAARSGSNEHIVVWRQSWTDTSSAAVFFKGGDKRQDRHEHLDTGDFLYDALGVRWNADLGPPTGYPAYVPPAPYTGSTSYQTYPKRAMGQNSIVVNPSRNDYLSRLVSKTWLDAVNPDQAMDDGTSSHWAPVQNLATSTSASVWSASVNFATTYARHGIRTAAQGASADPSRTFTWDRTTGALDIRDSLNFSQSNNEIFWYWQLPSAGHKPIYLAENRVVLQAMRGSTPVYLSIDLIASNASTNGGFKHSRIDENLPPNQPADAVLWGYDNATSQRSVFRKLTLRLTTTGNSIDTTIRVTPLPAISGLSESAALIQLGLLSGLESVAAEWPFNGNLFNVRGGSGIASAVGMPTYQTDAPEGTNSLLFDGIDDELSSNIALNPGASMTVAAWVKTAVGRSNIQTIAANSASGVSTGFKFYINNYGSSDGALVFESSNGVTMAKATSAAAAVPANTWTHVAAVVDRAAGHVRLFVNGVLVSTQSSVVSDSKSSGTLYLGRMAPGGSNFPFGGGIDDIHYVPRLLSAAEIRALVTAATAARWTFQSDLSEVTGSRPAAIAINGPVLSSSQVHGGSQALYIDGNDDAVNLGTIDLGNSFTFSQWVRITTGRSSMQTLLFSRPTGSTTGTALHLYANTWQTTDRKLILNTSNGSTSKEISSAAGAMPFGEWVHIAAVINRSGGTAKLYVNGAEVASGAVRTDFSNNVPLFIGSMGGGQYTQNLQAYCDDTRIDPRILTVDEIGGLSRFRGAAPLVSSVLVQPSPPVASQPLTVTVTASDANPADNLRHSILWGDGSAATPWSSSAISPSKVYLSGNSFNVIARVDDGTFITEAPVSISFPLPPNTSPTIGLLADIITNAGLTTAAAAFTVADAITPAASLIVTATSGDQTMLPDSALTLGGSGGSRTLTVAVPPWAQGTIPVTLRVSDGELSASTAVNVIISNTGWASNWTAVSGAGALPWAGGPNWSGSQAPISGPSAIVRFFEGQNLPSSSLFSNQNAANPFIMSEWFLSGAGPTQEGGSLTITGNPVRMVSPDGSASARIHLDATAGAGFSYIVGVATELTGNTTFMGDGDATFVFSGRLSGTGSLTKSGNSNLTLGGAAPHTLGGLWTIAGGSLVFESGLNQRIPNSSSLRFTESSQWDLGGNAQTLAGLDVPNSTDQSSVIGSILNGSLTLQTTGDIPIGPTTSNTGPINNTVSNLDLSGLSSFSLETPAGFVIQSKTYNTQSGSVTVSLADNNLIKADRLLVGCNAGSGTHSAVLELGLSNTLRMDEFAVGRSARSIAVFRNRSGLSGSAVTSIRAEDGTSRVAKFQIGEQWGGSGDNIATVDFTGGSVDALIDVAEIGRATSNPRPSTASLTIGSGGGVFDANRIVLAMTETNASGLLSATFIQNGGIVRAGALVFGSVTGSLTPQISSVYQLNSGASLRASAIVAGTSGNVSNLSERTLRWNGGTLAPLDSLSGLRVAGRQLNGPLKLDLVAPSVIDVPASQSAVFETTAVLSGSATLTKSGPGRLVLNAASPAFAGKCNVSGGSLEITGADAALGAVPATSLSDAVTLNGTSLILNRGWQGTLSMVSAGSGYTIYPTLDLAGVTAETIQTHGGVASVTVTNQGVSNRTGATIAFSAPDLIGGVAPVGTATVSAGKVTAISITSPGSGYTVPPKVFITLTGGTSTTTSPVASVAAVVLQGAVNLNPGHDYNGAIPTVSVIGGSGSGASFTATSGATPAISLASNRGILLSASGGTIGTTGDHQINGPLSGPGSLTKTGSGTLTLSGQDLHTGGTSISSGILKVLSASLHDTAPTVIESGAVLNLAHTSTDTIGSLILAGVAKPPGIYDSSNSNGFITGTGKLLVSGSAYSSWINGFFQGSLDPNLIGFKSDPDNDGISNGIEFVIGGDPKNEASSGKLPVCVMDSTKITFIFRRATAAAVLRPRVEYTGDLAGPWTVATHGTQGVTILEEPGGFGNGIDRVSVTIPRGAYTRRFVRLAVDAP